MHVNTVKHLNHMQIVQCRLCTVHGAASRFITTVVYEGTVDMMRA
jgi:hypothetical protein